MISNSLYGGWERDDRVPAARIPSVAHVMKLTAQECRELYARAGIDVQHVAEIAGRDQTRDHPATHVHPAGVQAAK
jgi:hypothetical protein